MLMRYIYLCSALLCCALAQAQDAPKPYEPFRYPGYVGFQGGFGSTTWQGLVPTQVNKNDALNISTPTRVTEGGTVWGFFAGYELSPFFAVEANYMRFPNATVFFDEESLFAFENDGETILYTRTETASIMGKVMLIIPHTLIRAYSSAGVARVQRTDDINRDWRYSPNFGLGLNYNFTEHVMGEFAFNYTAGYGESEISPAKDYVPFLYSLVFKLAYRF